MDTSTLATSSRALYRSLASANDYKGHYYGDFAYMGMDRLTMPKPL